MLGMALSDVHAALHMLMLHLRESRKCWSRLLSERSTELHIGLTGNIQKKGTLFSHRAYDRLAESIGATFVAFAVESSGGFGAETLKFAKELIALVKNVWAPHEVVQGIYRSIAIAVANGNADILEANLRACTAWD